MKSNSNNFNRLLKDQDGGILIIIALLMVVLLGMTALVIDVGYLYQVRRQMVNAADAAALAGAQELIYNPDNIPAVATAYTVELNNADDMFGLIIGDDTVAVSAGKNVELTFARILGISESYVTASAVAKIVPLSKGLGLAPFAIHHTAYEEGGNVVIKFDEWQQGDIGSGNYHLVDLEGQYKDNIANGSSQQVETDDWIDTLPGNKATIAKIIYDKFENCKGDGDHWNDEKGICNNCGQSDCDRIMYVIIYDEVALKPNETDYKPGKTKIHVVGFAAVYLLEEPTNPWGQYKEINTRFIKQLWKFDAVEGGSLDDFGLYKVKLIE